MIQIFIVLHILITDPGKITKINSLKSEAKKAFASGNYKAAIEKYRFLTDSLSVSEDEVALNLANAYFHENDTANAYASYQSLIQSSHNDIRSKANQQLGVLANRQSKFEDALAYFKQAIKADPANVDARYNYEMVKKKLEEKNNQENNSQNQEKDKDQKQDKNENQKDKENNEKGDSEKKDEQKESENKNEQNKDQQDKQQKDGESKENKEQQKNEKEKEGQEEEKKKDSSPSVSDKLKEMNVSEEKAKMLLEALKNQELQYLQQNKRKATKPKDKGRPDW